ncbi:hypothetical protein G6F34_001141 [Rhizopus arrhizus]|nr:hypothetical protein G6F34_001141 [Rhizopus arrhizus]
MITLPRAIGQLVNLEILDVSKNQLEFIPDSIQYLKKLKALNLSKNKLTHIPKTFGQLLHLTVLLLNHNHLTELPNEIAHLHHLEHFDISHNRLKSIPAEITAIRALKKFLADDCPFETESSYKLSHNPPSLFEICARQIYLHKIPVPNKELADYLKVAKRTCSFCSGPFFESYVSRKRMIEKQQVITLDYALCSAHWTDENDRLLVMFSTGNNHNSEEEDMSSDDGLEESFTHVKHNFAQLGSRLRILANYFIGDDILNLPRYKVSLLADNKLPHSQLQQFSTEQNLIVRDISGQPFLCNIPLITDEKEEENKEEKEEEEEEDKIIERGLNLLKPLENSCIHFYKGGDQYWSYEYCHNQYVRQFHIERTSEGKIERKREKESNLLGQYKKAKTTLKQIGDQRVLIQQWNEGSICDLTKKPRTTVVQYQCDYQQANDRVSFFTEVSSCQYQIIISTPRLCEEMKLSHLHKQTVYPIACKPIVSDKLIEAEREQKQIEAKQLKEIEEQQQQKILEEVKKDKEETLLEMVQRLNEQLDTLKSQVQTYLPNQQQEVMTEDNAIEKIFTKKNLQIIDGFN